MPETIKPDSSSDPIAEKYNDSSILQSAREKLKLMEIDVIRGRHFLRLQRPSVDVTLGILDDIENAEIFPDDVIVVGFPRCGNRWSYYITSMVLYQNLEFNQVDLLYKMLENVGAAASMNSCPRPRLITSHLHFDMLPKQLVTKRARVVFILRNPKDCFVSWYRVASQMKVDANLFSGSWAEFFELMLSGGYPWDTWFDSVLSAESLIKENPDLKIHVLQYERMKENPVEEISKLCRFLDKDVSLAPQIAERTEMESMRSEMRGRLIEVEESLFSKTDVLHKKGVIGDWKNYFTVDQSERLNKMFEEKMAGSQLADLVRPYLK